jgi:predicted deacylase
MMATAGKQLEYLAVSNDNGSEIEIPVASVTGDADGPTLLIVAGVHGSEYVGIEAASRLIRWTDPTRLAGTLLVVPCLNVPAFYGLAMHVNPIDDKNLGDLFPGDANGTITDRIARVVFDQLVAKADFVLDIHGGDLEEELVEYSQVNSTGNDGIDAKAEALARSLDMPIYLRAPAREVAPARGGLFEMASVLGTPAVLVEAGSHGDLDESIVAVQFKAMRNALYHLGMLTGTPIVANPAPLELHRFLGVEAPVDGFWYPYVRKGEIIRKGQALGEMRDFFDTRLAVVSSEEDAAILGVMTVPPRRKGDWVMGLGTLR